MQQFLKSNGIVKNALILLLFLVVALVIYYPTLRSEPLWDDWIFIFKSTALKHAKLWQFWTWGEYRRSWPLFYSFMSLMYKTFNEQTVYYHLLSVFLHSFNSYFIYRILKRMEGAHACLLSLIYLVHPLNFYTVSWIVQTKTLMCIFFFLISLDLFLKYQKNNSNVLYWVSVISFTLSVMSKSAFAPLIVLMPFYKNKSKMLPFAIICIYSIMLTAWSTHLQGYVENIKISSYFVSDVIAEENITTTEKTKIPPRKLGLLKEKDYDPLRNVTLTFNNLVRYSSFVFFPTDALLVQTLTIVNYSYKELVSSVVLILLLIFIIFKFWKKKDFISLTGITFYLLSLIPLCGLFFIPIFQYSNYVEYWLSVPVLGIILCVSRIQFRKVEITSILLLAFIVFSFKTLFISIKTPNPVRMLTEASIKSPESNLIKLILAKHYYFTKEYIKSNEILLNVKRTNTMDREKLDRDINLNFKLMNGEKIEDHEIFVL